MVPFLPWTPDIADFQTNCSTEALNVIPSSAGFLPFPSFQPIAAATTARVQGAVSVRSLSGSIFNFCGDETKLYKLDSSGLTWSDVSRTVGGAYATSTDSKWSFSQYGDYVIAVNGNDAAQVFQLGVSSNFAALGGSPPNGTFTGTIREFGVIARTGTANNRVAWSAIGNVASWVPSAATLSDYQELPDGGAIQGFVGGEFGIIFQERAVTRMSFEGPPTAFRFDKISNFLGCRADGSIAAFENFAFFLGDDGFYMIRGGAEIVPIGVEKVDRWLEANINASYLYRVTSTVDPVNKLYICGFPSKNTSLGTPDTLLIYHWPTGQWTHANLDHEMLYQVANQTTYTIDGMDAVAATVDELPYPVDSRFWAGTGRLMLAGFDASHQLGVFSGANLEATLETAENQLVPGRRSLFRGCRPMIEGTTSITPAMSIGYRNNLFDTLNYTAPKDVNAYGYCNARVNGRYHRFRLTVPAGSDWNFARGIDDLQFSPMGGR